MTDKLRDAAQQALEAYCRGWHKSFAAENPYDRISITDESRKHILAGLVEALIALAQQDAQAVPQVARVPYTGDVVRIMREAGMTFHLGLPHKAVVEQMTRVVDLVYSEASIKSAQKFAAEPTTVIPEALVKWASSPELVETGNDWKQGYEHARAWVHVQLSLNNAAPTPPAQQGYTAADMADQGAGQFRAGHDAAQSEIAELEQENRLMRARNDLLDAELKVVEAMLTTSDALRAKLAQERDELAAELQAAKEAEQDAVATMRALGVERAALLDFAKWALELKTGGMIEGKARAVVSQCTAGVQAAGGDQQANVLLALQNAHTNVQHLPSDDTEGGAL